MNRFLTLINLMHRTGWLSNLVHGTKNGKQKSVFLKVLICFGLGTIVLAICTLLFFICYGIIKISVLENGVIDSQYLTNLMTIYVPLYLAMVLVFISMIVLHVFYLNNDNQFFMPMPIKSTELFLAKFFYVLDYSYLVQAILIIPCYIAFNLVIGFKVYVVLSQIIAFFALPLLPFAICILIQRLLVKIINFGKNKGILSFICYLLSLVLLLAMELISSTAINFNGALSSDAIKSFKISISNLASSLNVSKFVFHSLVAGSLNNNFFGFLSVIGFLLITIAITAIVITIVAPGFSKVLVDNSNSTQVIKKKRDLDTIIKEETTSTKNQLTAYIVKEWRTLMRNSSIVISYIIPPILMVLVLGSIIFITLFVGDSTKEAMNILIKNMQNLATFDSGFVIYYIVAISVGVSSFNLTSATAISREGQNAYFLKYTPVTSFRVIIAKIFWPFILNSAILTTLIISVGFVFNLSWYIVLLSWLASILITLFIQFLMISIDLKRPYLNWTNESDVNKNLNMFLSILSCVSLIIMFIGIGLLNHYITKLNVVLAFFIIIIVVIALTLIITMHLKKRKSHVFDNI